MLSSPTSEYSWGHFCPNCLPGQTPKLQGLTVCTQTIVWTSEVGHTDFLGAEFCCLWGVCTSEGLGLKLPSTVSLWGLTTVRVSHVNGAQCQRQVCHACGRRAKLLLSRKWQKHHLVSCSIILIISSGFVETGHSYNWFTSRSSWGAAAVCQCLHVL